MKFFIVVLMAILLPLQTAWSAAAVFCQHEHTTAWHWGHHQHVADAACQQSSVNATAHDTTDKNDSKFQGSSFQDSKSQEAGSFQKDSGFQKHALTQKDAGVKNDSSPYASTVVNHSDHLTGNQPGLNPNPQVVLMQPSVQDHKVALQSLIPALYQSPVLEQPKPPLWPA